LNRKLPSALQAQVLHSQQRVPQIQYLFFSIKQLNCISGFKWRHRIRWTCLLTVNVLLTVTGKCNNCEKIVNKMTYFAFSKGKEMYLNLLFVSSESNYH